MTIKTKEQITKEERRALEHALGLDYKDKPYRNNVCFYSEEPIWEELRKKGLAFRNIIKDPNKTYWYYYVTEEGAKLLGVKLPKE